MKKLLIAAAIIFLSATISNADAVYRSGQWSTFQTITNKDSTPMCGMQTSYPRDGANILIKYFLGNSGLSIQIYKDTWRFPADSAVDVPVILGVDRNPLVTTTAIGGQVDGDALIEFDIANDQVEGFLREFSNATRLWIDFPQGNEPRWNAGMTGSRNAAVMFKGCIVDIIQKAKSPTQPYSSGAKPTQPVMPKASRKDDGSI